jgi:hypothetical protein
LPGGDALGLVTDAVTAYVCTASAVTDTNLSGATGPVAMSGTKYGTVVAPVATDMAADDDLGAAASTWTMTWYLPTEPTTAATGETAATGDRWNKADKLVPVATSTVATTNTSVLCSVAAGIALTLGASTLAAAGAASVAAALSI